MLIVNHKVLIDKYNNEMIIFMNGYIKYVLYSLYKTNNKEK